MSVVFSPSRQKGIHKVTRANERVMVNYAWSINVPVGYSYLADMEKTAMDVNGNHYYLQIQKSDDCDFSESYSSEISLTVKGDVGEVNGYYPTTTEYIEIFKQFAGMLTTPVFVKMNKDILVAYAYVPMFGSYNFYVHAAGTNYIYQGQITFDADKYYDSTETEKIVKRFVNSVEPVKLEDICDTKHLTRLDSSYALDFDNNEYIKVDNNFKVPVPKGFHGTTSLSNDSILCFIAQKDFDLDGDINDAKIALQIQQISDDSYVDPDNLDNAMKNIMQWFTDQGQPYFSHEKITLRRSKKGLIMNSLIANTPCTKNYNYGFVYSDSKLYIVAMVITYPGPISDYPDTQWDARAITESWLSRIVLKGESVKVSKKEEPETHDFKIAIPEKSQYPHYQSKLDAQNVGAGLPGVTVVVNESGTEYAFHGLSEALISGNDDFSEKTKELFGRIIKKDSGDYTLDGKATEMSHLFHVDKSAFDPRHDKESEIQFKYIRKAYMMNALRSFAWTLSDYCSQQKKQPDELDYSLLKEIADFVATRGWLNYDDHSYCKGLCTGSDLHVYFVPDSVTENDRKELLPKQEDFDRIKKMRSINPAYNEILTEVHSLDSLRRDLERIYPAIMTLFTGLAASRDTSKPLDGNEADIVYAWCSLALAAKEPFFTEDGPMTCFFTQLPEDPSLSINHNEVSSSAKGDKTSKQSKYKSKKNTLTLSSIPVANKTDRKKRLIDGVKKEKYPVRFFYGFETGEEPEKLVSIVLYLCDELRPGFYNEAKTLSDKADEYLDTFGADIKDEILQGLLRDTKPIHSLRSFIWTAVEMNGGQELPSADNFSQEVLERMMSVIACHGYANYKATMNHPERFGADFMLSDDFNTLCEPKTVEDFRFNHVLLYSDQFAEGFTKALQTISVMDSISLIDDLEKLSPFIEKLLSLLSGDYNDNVCDSARNIILGWCAFATYCRYPFFIMPVKYAPEKKNLEHIKKTLEGRTDPVSMGQNRYTVVDNVIVNIKSIGSTVVIPEGIKDVITILPKEDLFRGAKEIVYPRSYEGRICIPNYIEKAVINTEKKVLDAWSYYFSNNEKLKEVYFNGHNKEIYFTGGENLRKAVLPDTLEKICSDMFRGCSSLTDLHLPIGLKEIGRNAFLGCGVKDMTLPAGLEKIEDDALNDTKPEYTVRVYKGTKGEEALQKYCEIQNAHYEELNREYPNWGPDDSIKMRIVKLDAPWVKKAEYFVEKIKTMYDAPYEQDKMRADISSMIDSTFDLEFDHAKDSVMNGAEGKSLTTLCNVLKKCDNMSMLKEKLPVILATEIPAEAKKQAYEKRHGELTSEIKSVKNRIEELENSITENSSKSDELNAEINEKKRELQEKHNKYDALIEEKRKNWSALSSDLHEEISDSKLYLEKLCEQINTKKNELNGLSFLQFGKKKELTQIIGDLDKAIKNEQVNNDALISKLNKAEREYHTSVDSLQKEMSSISVVVSDLETHVDQLLRQTLEYKQGLAGKESRLSELKKELEKLESDNKQL